MGSALVDSTSHRSKILRKKKKKKIPESSNKQNFNLLWASNYLSVFTLYQESEVIQMI